MAKPMTNYVSGDDKGIERQQGVKCGLIDITASIIIFLGQGEACEC